MINGIVGANLAPNTRTNQLVVLSAAAGTVRYLGAGVVPSLHAYGRSTLGAGLSAMAQCLLLLEEP